VFEGPEPSPASQYEEDLIAELAEGVDDLGKRGFIANT